MRPDNTGPADFLEPSLVRTVEAARDYLAGVGVPHAHFSRRDLAVAVVALADLAGLTDPLDPFGGDAA